MNASTHNFSITLKPSRALFISFCILHVLAAVTLILISIPIWVKVIAVVITLALGVNSILQYVLLKSDNAVIKISATSTANKCRIETNNGKNYQAYIKHAGWLFDYFAMLVIDANAKNYKTIIAKDTISQEQFYALRLYLRSFNSSR